LHEGRPTDLALCGRYVQKSEAHGADHRGVQSRINSSPFEPIPGQIELFIRSHGPALSRLSTPFAESSGSKDPLCRPYNIGVGIISNSYATMDNCGVSTIVEV
jgi:hypothetical protein